MTTNRRIKPRGTTTQSGYWAAKRALMRFGSYALDGRSSISKALDELRSALVNDLGGPEAISKQQDIIIGLALRTHLLLESLDAFIFTMSSPVNKRKRGLYPVVRERQHLADSLAKYMAQLGLEKRTKPVEDLDAFLERKAREKAEANEHEVATEEPTEPVDHRGDG